MSFIQNAWYPAAWADEIGPETLLARTIAGTPVVMFRTERRAQPPCWIAVPTGLRPCPAGANRRTASRAAITGLLSMRRERCIHNPHGPITRALKVQAYPCVERHEAIWLWPGDPRPR